MRIHLSNVVHNSRSGPNTFGRRLARELRDRGHEIVGHMDPHDIFLAFIEGVTPPASGAKTILRLDGIWFKPEQFHMQNQGIRRCYDTFDHVIFQSEFDKSMVEKHFGPRENCSVIHNGIDPNELSSGEQFECDPKHLGFVCSASWHPQKRLTDNVRLFQHIRRQLCDEGKDASLAVLGFAELLFCPDNDPADPFRATSYVQRGDPRRVPTSSGKSAEFESLSDEDKENVRFFPNLIQEKCLSIYRMADYMIHLAWLDHCPNVVVEAISQGCPVICTDSGGTHEIVGDNGIVIPEITQYNLELLDYDNPFRLDWSHFTLPDERPAVDRDSVHIREVADKYERVFHHVDSK